MTTFSITVQALSVLRHELSQASAIARRPAAKCLPVEHWISIYEAAVEVSVQAYVSLQDSEVLFF